MDGNTKYLLVDLLEVFMGSFWGQVLVVFMNDRVKGRAVGQ